MSYYLATAIARERQKTLLAEAEAFRRAKEAQTHRERACGTDRTAHRWRLGRRLTHRAVPITETVG